MSSTKKRKAKRIGGSLIPVIAIIIVIAVLALYYFDVPPFDFDLGIGFKYSVGLPVDRIGKLKVHFIDVGQGDCIFIELPDGKNIIVDGGDGTKAHNKTVIDYLEKLNISTIDYCILTHSDEDHVGGLVEVINSDIDVLSVYMPYIGSSHDDDILSKHPEIIPDSLDGIDYLTVSTKVYKNFVDAVISEGLTSGNVNDKIIINLDGLQISNGYYSIDFLMPTVEIYRNKKNDAEYKNAVSPIITLKYNNKSIMLTGDSNSLNEKAFVNAYKYDNVSTDVLKVGHHGSGSSSTQDFLDIVDPDYAVICVGTGNDYGHPSQGAIDRLLNIGSTIYRTDFNGTIILTISAEVLSFDFYSNDLSFLGCKFMFSAAFRQTPLDRIRCRL